MQAKIRRDGVQDTKHREAEEVAKKTLCLYEK